MKYNGIDRKDNSEGYTEENSVPCCWECNQSKHTRNEGDFLSWIKRVYEYNFKIKPNEIEG